MIKFTPYTVEVKSPLVDPEGYVNNISNIKVAEQLTDKFGDKGCPLHPNFENEFIVDLSKGEDFLELQSFCCNEFKPTLDLLSQNKNPFVE